ncbi:phage tail spike protein [Paraclostridium bifermentans]|uniref:phage tail spike protein n=1 Tax=Paraclostridium bifermentans TaxID=1490 RepID=UPI001FF4EAED|nr:phage tail spike protein [Paraclostridium bifermentans]UOW66854.1 phage tail protein [Paraclostridium bifermentans]
MIPILYDKTGKVKFGELVDIIDSGYVEEERNGIFEFTIDYPVGYPLSDLLVEENMIETKPNEEQGLQKFRIYDTKRLMKNVISVFARHESFALANDHVENVNLENASCEYALNTLFRNSHFSTHYRGYSDIINAQNYKIDNVNILNAIAGKEGSIIDTYGTGAEILRDGTNIHVLNKRGHDNEVTIEFGKNLTDFVLERDLTDLETRVGGFAKYTPEGGKETIVKSNWIDSPYIDNFAHPYINIDGRRDYSDKFKDGEIPTVEKLNKLCADEFKINKRDIPKSNYTIKFIALSKCVGYEGTKDKISLCDTVRIIDKRFNVDTKAKVIKYKYDFVKERYESMELGEPRTTLGDVIGGSSGEQGPPGKDGQNGKDGEQGPPGKDADVENMPDTLPETPVLYSKVYGMGGVELSWSFENKLYYNYELYASRIPDFNPTAFDLIHSGQSSSHFFKANPGETWYFRVCAINSHSKRTPFSNQVVITLPKVEDMNNYFSEMAIGKAVVQSLSADYMEAGIIKAHWIELKGASVVDGNGVRTLDINSFGDVKLAPRVIMVGFNGISDNFVLDKTGIDWKNAGSKYKNLSIKKGSIMLYNWQSGAFLGGFSPILLSGSELKHAGHAIIAGSGASYTVFGRDDTWKDTSSGPTSPVQSMAINYIDRGTETALLQGVHTYHKYYAHDGIDLIGTGDLTNVKNIFLNGRINFSGGYYLSPYQHGLTVNGTMQSDNVSTNLLDTKSGSYIYTAKTITPNQANKFNCGEFNYPWSNVYSKNGVSVGATFSMPSARSFMSMSFMSRSNKVESDSIIDLIKINEDNVVDVTNVIGTKYHDELLEGSIEDGFFINQNKLMSMIIDESKKIKSNQLEQDELLINNAYQIASMKLGVM